MLVYMHTGGSIENDRKFAKLLTEANHRLLETSEAQALIATYQDDFIANLKAMDKLKIMEKNKKALDICDVVLIIGEPGFDGGALLGAAWQARIPTIVLQTGPMRAMTFHTLVDTWCSCEAGLLQCLTELETENYLFREATGKWLPKELLK